MEKLKNEKIEKKFRKLEKKNKNILLQKLKEEYPDAKCSLDFTSPFSLTVALILAAQNTDKNVNQVTPLFLDHFKDIKSVADATVEEIEKIVKPCGFYKTKAKYIKKTASILCEKTSFPSSMQELITLPGIGRKSANILMQECFNTPVGIAVDTHVTRLSKRMGLSNETTQEKIENDLMKYFSKEDYSLVNHLFVYHGRAICSARNAKCDICPINDICKKNSLNKS